HSMPRSAGPGCSRFRLGRVWDLAPGFQNRSAAVRRSLAQVRTIRVHSSNSWHSRSHLLGPPERQFASPNTLGIFQDTNDTNRTNRHSTNATTRTGLPLPFTILSGAAITTAPVAGSLSRLRRLASPNLPLPCIVAWLGKGGSNVPA